MIRFEPITMLDVHPEHQLSFYRDSNDNEYSFTHYISCEMEPNFNRYSFERDFCSKFDINEVALYNLYQGYYHIYFNHPKLEEVIEHFNELVPVYFIDNVSLHYVNQGLHYDEAVKDETKYLFINPLTEYDKTIRLCSFVDINYFPLKSFSRLRMVNIINRLAFRDYKMFYEPFDYKTAKVFYANDIDIIEIISTPNAIQRTAYVIPTCYNGPLPLTTIR